MATEHDAEPRDPAHMAPRDVLERAVGGNKAIHCTTAHGRETRFVAVATPGFDGTTWVAVDEPDSEGCVVTETHVRNAVRRCQPDVRVTDASEVLH